MAHYMELWDAYDEKLNKIEGMTIVRGEDPITCALRELSEETGIKADKLTEVGRVLHPKYDGLLYIAHRSVGLDNGYYIYLLENHGFDDYLFLMRYDNLDDEDFLL